MPDIEFVTLTKLEVAQRQLRQGIRMFFQRADAIALHTVASAAYAILSDLCGHKGIVREIEDSRVLEAMGIKEDFIRALRSPQNFIRAHRTRTARVSDRPAVLPGAAQGRTGALQRRAARFPAALFRATDCLAGGASNLNDSFTLAR